MQPAVSNTSSGKAVKTRKPKAQTLRDVDWAPHKPRIIQLHITENIPLKNVRDSLKTECGFKAE